MATDADGASTQEPATDDGPSAERGPLAMSWPIGRVAAVATFVVIVVFWAWVFSGAPAKQNPDYLARPYAAKLEARCQALRDDLATLPSAPTLPERTERADVLEQANAMVGDFIDDVAAGAPTHGDDARAVKGWLADWRTYLKDRERYVVQLREGRGDRFYVEASPLGDSVDETIEVFADVNGIDACATPGDVG